LLRLRRLGAGGIFDTFADHFEAMWATATTSNTDPSR
jgi:hypothetical protein